jgi:hypothetical protein
MCFIISARRRAMFAADHPSTSTLSTSETSTVSAILNEEFAWLASVCAVLDAEMEAPDSSSARE